VYWDGDWHMNWMGLWMVLGVVLVAVLLWAFLRGLGGVDGVRRSAEDTPEQLLKRRYARGEIDRETFLRMRDDLKG